MSNTYVTMFLVIIIKQDPMCKKEGSSEIEIIGPTLFDTNTLCNNKYDTNPNYTGYTAKVISVVRNTMFSIFNNYVAYKPNNIK